MSALTTTFSYQPASYEPDQTPKEWVVKVTYEQERFVNTMPCYCITTQQLYISGTFDKTRMINRQDSAELPSYYVGYNIGT